MRKHIKTLTVLCALALTFAAPMIASAAPEDSEPAAAPVTTSDTAAAPVDNSKGLGLIAAALVTGLAGIGGGVAVAAAAPAAIGATSEDPKAFGKSLIFVALGEGIALRPMPSIEGRDLHALLSHQR